VSCPPDGKEENDKMNRAAAISAETGGAIFDTTMRPPVIAGYASTNARRIRSATCSSKADGSDMTRLIISIASA